MTHLDLGSSIKLLDPNARFQHFSYGFKQNLSLIIKLGCFFAKTAPQNTNTTLVSSIRDQS